MNWLPGGSIAMMLVVVLSTSLVAQQPGRGRAAGGPPPTPRAAAPIDLTGNWVSVVNEDWRWRMITPPRGDYANIPLNAAARKVADTWDPAKDEAAGEQCRGYAAPAIMREPTRLRISWQDDYTLKLETDAGMQTRLFQFARPEGEPTVSPGGTTIRSWQGFSVARWEQPPAPIAGRGFGLGLATRAGTQGRSLEVVTTRIRPGYLRKNGIPFSENAAMTEYYDAFVEAANGPSWFVVTTIVRDPQYLGEPWITSSHFKKESDGAKWNPTPCRTR